MPRPPRSVVLALLLPALAACQPPSGPRRQANAAVVSNCRTEADRVYAAQNRVDLSRQDERDEPFAASYVSGIVTRDLGAQYARSNMIDSCVRANGGPAQVAPAGEGSTFNPGLSRP